MFDFLFVNNISLVRNKVGIKYSSKSQNKLWKIFIKKSNVIADTPRIAAQPGIAAVVVCSILVGYDSLIVAYIPVYTEYLISSICWILFVPVYTL